MKRTNIPRYIVQDDRGQFLGEWITTASPNKTPHGRPTAQNLMKWRDTFNLSLCKGGANDHIGAAAWIQRRIHIFDQYTRRKVVEYSPPMFEALPTTEEAATERARQNLYSHPPETRPRALAFAHSIN